MPRQSRPKATTLWHNDGPHAGHTEVRCNQPEHLDQSFADIEQPVINDVEALPEQTAPKGGMSMTVFL